MANEPGTAGPREERPVKADADQSNLVGNGRVAVVRQVVYGDWHRVELAIDALMSRASRTIDVPGGELEDVFLWQLN